MADVVRATMDELYSKNELDKEIELDAVLELDAVARSIAIQHVGKFRG